jgi:hypothetical protein
MRPRAQLISFRKEVMKRILGIIAALAIAVSFAHAQSDNTLHVKDFPGANVGAKVAAAQRSCSTNTTVPCTLVIDSSLAAAPAGTLPALCANCFVQDLRIGGATNARYINGIPQADQFAGADFCSKLLNAEQAAIAAGKSLVDASHFSGTVQCASDPFSGLVTAGTLTAGQMANLTVLFPAAKIQTSVPWLVNFSGLNVKGMGAFATRIEYTGTTTANIVSVAGNDSYYIYNFSISDAFVYGGAGNVTNAALYLTYTHHADIRSVYTWGAVRGIHTVFAVTNTFYRPRTSTFDANLLGILGAAHTTPTNGLYFDKAASGKKTTDSTIIDAAAEGLNGTGWVLAAANSMTFTGGTSEGNTTSVGVPGGVDVRAGSSYNNFLSPDFEANSSGLDFLNNGSGSYVRNAIMTSGASPFTEGASAIWTDIEGGSFDTVSGTPARWVRFGNQILGSDQLFAGNIKNANGVVIPASATGNAGNSAGQVELVQTCTTGSITTSASAGGQVSGTCTLPASATGHSGISSAADGTAMGNTVQNVSVNGTTATVTLTTIQASAGVSKTFNITVF